MFKITENLYNFVPMKLSGATKSVAKKDDTTKDKIDTEKCMQ